MRDFILVPTILCCVTQAQAAPPVVIETVTVGNPGNAGDPIQFQGTFGAVDYVFRIGKYEVTAAQYTAFLDAVAASDPYGLYDARMWTHAEGCKIERTGSPGSYAYAVAPDRAERPVNFVSWGDAARFANWLHNGQPSGPPDLAAWRPSRPRARSSPPSPTEVFWRCCSRSPSPARERLDDGARPPTKRRDHDRGRSSLHRHPGRASVGSGLGDTDPARIRA
jgi:hypothetical protein